VVVGRVLETVTLIQKPPEPSHEDWIIVFQEIGPELIDRHEDREGGWVRIFRRRLAC
jgi:hypothetical protein